VLECGPADEKEVTLANKSKDALDRAEAAFQKKEQRAREGSEAMAEYEAAGCAVSAKTEQLRSLRLAKEAAEVTAKPKKKSAASAKKSSSD
jgi:hypothetical protein